MSTNKPPRNPLVGELTLHPREKGQTTESAYRQSLEASPSFKLELPAASKKRKKKKR